MKLIRIYLVAALLLSVVLIPAAAQTITSATYRMLKSRTSSVIPNSYRHRHFLIGVQPNDD
jgi:hypothetical protein